MTQHTCAVCQHAFGVSTFPGGSTIYCSRTCGTRWGIALLPVPVRVTERLQELTICAAGLELGRCTKCSATLSLRYRAGRALTQCRGGCRRPQQIRLARTSQVGLITGCAYCGAPFTLTRTSRKYCRIRCRNLGNPRKCSRDSCTRAHRAKGLCHRHYKDERYPKQQPYVFPSDPEAKRKRDVVKSMRRRAAQRRADAENVDRDIVGDRDGWRCGICQRKVDRSLVYPLPLSPSLDHVVPISQGGLHTYANTRITHLTCNNLRSNRGGNEQLAIL